MNQDLQDLEIKVENEGTTPQGRLTATEWNILVAAVKSLDLTGGSVDITSILQAVADAGYATREWVNNQDYATTTDFNKFVKDFVTLDTTQAISGIKDFTNGLKVGGLSVYKSQADTIYLNANLVVRGGITAFGTNETITASIFEALPIDGATLKRTENGVLYVDTTVVGGGGGTGGGISIADVENYLTTNGYATQSWVTGKGYITGITLSMVTNALGYTPLDKQGVAFDSNKFGGLSVADFARVKQEVSDFDANNMPDGVWGGKLFGSPNWALNYYAYLSVGSGNYKMQFNGVGNRLTYRAGTESGIENKDWVEILSSANYSNYALPITGGTVNGDVTANIYYANKGFVLSNVGDEYSGLAAGSHISSVGNAKDIWLYNSSADIKVYTPTIFSVLGGNVALGGATASEKLHVYGNMLFEGETALKSSLIGEVLYMSGSYLVIGGGSRAKGIPTYIDGQTVYVRVGNYVATFSDAGGLTWNGDFLANGALRLGQNNRTCIIENPFAAYGMTLADSNNNPLVTVSYFSDHAYVYNYKNSKKNSGIAFYDDGRVVVAQNLIATGGITAQNSSDMRLKKNIRKFNASKVLMSLGAVWEYEYIDSEVQKNHIYEGTHYGLIYQHVKGTKLDVMCHEREDGMGALNYIHPKFISLIAGATMENISEVQKLKHKIRTLEAKVKQLENRA